MFRLSIEVELYWIERRSNEVQDIAYLCYLVKDVVSPHVP